jgi:hypothetical protein
MSAMETVLAIFGGAVITVVAIFALVLAGEFVVVRLRRRWRRFLYARSDYGWVLAARYRLGVRLLAPYLTVRASERSAEANELRARLSVDEIRASYRLRQVEGSLFELHSIARTFAPSKRFLGETLQPILDEPASSESDAGAL